MTIPSKDLPTTILASTTTLDLLIQVVEGHKGHRLTQVLALHGHLTIQVVLGHQHLTLVYNRPVHTLVPKAHQVDTQGPKVQLEITQDRKDHRVVIPAHKGHQVAILVHKDHQVVTQVPKVLLETIQGTLDPVLVHKDLQAGQVGLGIQDQVPLHPILDQDQVVRDIRQVDLVGQVLMEVVVGEGLHRNLTENISRLEIN